MQFSYLSDSNGSSNKVSSGMGIVYNSQMSTVPTTDEVAFYLDSQLRAVFPVGPNYLMDQVIG